MKVSICLTLLGAGLAFAAPTGTVERDIPTIPQPYGPSKSVYRPMFKRRVPEEPAVDVTVGSSPPMYSVTPVPYKRSVEEGLPQPEHYEVLTA